MALADAGAQQPAAGLVRWSADERAVLASLSLQRLPPVPANPSNAVEQQSAAIELGRRLIEDARLSHNGAVSCATCYDSAKQFQDGLPVSRGVGMLTDDPALEGAFKTPGLRGVAERPPYMHAGQFATLQQVVRHYVAVPQHAGGNYQDPSQPGPASWVRRPIEISQAIDRVAADDRLAAHLQLDKVDASDPGWAWGHAVAAATARARQRRRPAARRSPAVRSCGRTPAATCRRG